MVDFAEKGRAILEAKEVVGIAGGKRDELPAFKKNPHFAQRFKELECSFG